MGLVLLLPPPVATETLRGLLWLLQAMDMVPSTSDVATDGRLCLLASLWQARVTNFYISDRNSGKRFYVRAGEGDVITPMIRYKTTSFDGSKKGASQNLKNWMATNELSYNGDLRVKEG